MKKLKVIKIGGGVFTDPHVLPSIGNVIKHEMSSDYKLVVVASAMGKDTRGLLQSIPADIIPKPDLREQDQLLAIGENKSCAILAMYLKSVGIKAASFTGAQAGILTDDNFGDANIIDINTKILDKWFLKNDVAVITGFQGVTGTGEITTLGFNGSDTSAFYLAHYLNAKSCTLYKDVNGVYDKDPKECKDAKLYKHLNFKEVLGGQTSGVVHHKALRLCAEMFNKENPTEIIIRNINLTQSLFTTICKKRTEFHM